MVVTHDSLAAKALRSLSPGYSQCGRCGYPWKFTEPHTTRYTVSSGCFPLCEKCWEGLTVDERLPYYEELIASWDASGYPVAPETAQAIRDAVMKGL